MEDMSVYDPVMLAYGKKVYSYRYIEKLRKMNLDLSGDRRIRNICPQAGFQEKVCLNDADILIIGGRRGGGKMNPIDTKIVTPFGLRRLGDLKVGSVISNPRTGGMEKVVQIFEHKNKDVYEVQFADGATCECGLEHLWQIKLTNHQHKTRKINGYGQEADWRVVPFSFIKEHLDKNKDNKSPYKRNVLIPVTQPVKFTKSGLSMWSPNYDPYIIGALVGDGCLRQGAVKLTSADEEIVAQFKQFQMSISQKEGANCKEYSIRDAELKDALIKLKLYGLKSEEKFIPTCYKMGTIETRLAFMQGLMDTDGYVGASGKIYYSTVSPRLAEDVKFVIESLGGTATICKKKAGYKKDGIYIKCQDAYELYIRIDNKSQLFRLKRKIEKVKPYNGGVSQVHRRITGYRYIGKKDCRCITVDDIGSLYMTEGCVVTHNTFAIELAPLRYIDNPLFSIHGFRKEENDIERGLWKTSKKLYMDVATPKESDYSWVFPSGATSKYEHLHDENKIDQRFRGTEMPFVMVDEVPQITKETFFTLLASNRNTIGVDNQFMGTCNPVGEKHWLHQFLWYYIDPDTKTIIPERDGKTIYFFKYGKEISEIVWGMTKKEVYEKAKDYIDSIFDKRLEALGQSPLTLINSLCFIEGQYAENAILMKNDPNYLGNLAQQGGESSYKDICGRWVDLDDNDEELIPASDWEACYGRPGCDEGEVTGVADVALSRDGLVLGAFRGNRLFAIESYRKVGSETAKGIVLNFMEKHGIPLRNFAFDSDGIGNYLKEPLKWGKGGAYAFNNNSASTDSRIWYNQKAECTEKFAQRVREGGFAIEPELRDKIIDGKPLWESLAEQRRVIRRKQSNQSKFQVLPKNEMKMILGGKRSPDIMEMIIMHEHFNIIAKQRKKVSVKGLGWLQ